jgi:hypothetical protein
VLEEFLLLAAQPPIKAGASNFFSPKAGTCSLSFPDNARSGICPLALFDAARRMLLAAAFFADDVAEARPPDGALFTPMLLLPGLRSFFTWGERPEGEMKAAFESGRGERS